MKSLASFSKFRELQERTITVIGGGIVGTTQAYYLSQDKRNKVILIDKNSECGQETSKANSCIVIHTHSFPYLYQPIKSFFPKGLYKREVIQKVYPMALLEPGFAKFTGYWLFGKEIKDPFKVSDQMIKLNSLTHDYMRKYLSDEKIDQASIDYREDCIYANLYQIEESQRAAMVQKLTAMTKVDTYLNQQEIEERIMTKRPEFQQPSMFNLCGYEPVIKCNTQKLTQSLQKVLSKRQNVKLMLGRKVSGVDFKDNQVDAVRLTGIQDPIRTDALVLCLGPFTSRFMKNYVQGSLSYPITPIKGYSIDYRIPHDFYSKMNSQYDTKYHLKFSQLGFVFTYLQNENGDMILRVSGFGDIAGLDSQPDQDRLDYLKSLSRALIHKDIVNDKNIIQEWCGLRPCSPDDKAILGQAYHSRRNPSYLSNLFMNVGQGARGLTQSFGSSLVTSKLVNGDYDQEWYDKYAAPFSSKRFFM